MRILMISDVYFPRVNGVSTSIATHRASLQALGHEVSLIAPAYPTGQTEEGWVHRVRSRSIPFDPEDRLMSGGAVMALERMLREQAFDIVHIQTPFVAHYAGLRLAQRLELPVIESYHTYFEHYLGCYLPLPDRLARWLARRISRGQGNAVDVLVTPSRAMGDKLREYGIIRPIRIIPTGLDPSQYEAGDGPRFRAMLGIDPACPLMLYVGRVAHEKNIGFLLEVLVEVRRLLPETHLLIAGEGPAESRLHRLAATLGLGDHVRFTGYLERRGALRDCYAAADVFVFSSLTETQGLVLLEAMATGCPVVAHAVMGAGEVLSDGEGCLVAAPGDHADFAARVLRLLQDPALRREQGDRARAHAAGWSNEVCAHAMVQCYEAVRQRHAARRNGSEHGFLSD